MVNFSFAKRELGILAILLGVSFLVRVLLFPLQGYVNDINTYSAWFNTAAEHGIRPFYDVAGFADYPPFSVYLFWAFGSIAKATAINTVTMVKLLPNIFDLATAALIFFFLRRQTSFKLAVTGTALYAFNPAVIYNAAIWGQFDAIYTFFLILSLILALKSKPKLSATAFALGILTKPQGIALAPLIAFLIYKKNGVKNLLFSVAVFAATVFVVILPFEWSNPITFLSNIYFGAYGGYAATSINAFNLWALYGLWIPDGGLNIVGWALFGGFALFILYSLHKRFKVSNEMLWVFGAFMLLFAFFMLPTRIHERYLFPVISVLALMFPLIKRVRLLYVGLTATLLVNQAYVLYWLNDYANKGYNYSHNLTGDPVVLVVSAINLLLLFYASMLMWLEIKGRNVLAVEKTAETQKPEGGKQK
jgi:Gpi18-like mannosyltransferase